jgi:Ribonuclease G/E
MKGRVVVLGQFRGRNIAALVVDGVVDDLLIDPADDQTLAPGTIPRATADRPVKGQGGMFMALPGGAGFFRGAKGMKPGQSVLVQVTSIPEPGKAVPVTDRILFKGRSAIVTPGKPGLNISRKVAEEERVRLHDVASDVMEGRPHGVIMRSAAEGLATEDITEELGALADLTDQVLADTGREPAVLVDGPDAHELAWREWASPAADAVEQGETALADFGVLDAVEAAEGALVELGEASMFVEPTRALTAVDVNTGADTSPAAALKANLAAARALPRALRLRGLGGQLTVDFAPLSKKDRRQVESALRAAFRRDPVETALVGWTPLGHYELQRKRERIPL